MADDKITTTGIAAHGASRLPRVEIDSFNIELKDEEGFLGDRASKGAFREILDRWRKPLRKLGEDPFGKEPSENISKKVLDTMLVGNDTEAAAVVHTAIEEFAQELAYVTRRFLKTKAWDKTQRIGWAAVSEIEQQVQSAGKPHSCHPANRKARHGHRDAQ
jgi:hypothetical protein